MKLFKLPIPALGLFVVIALIFFYPIFLGKFPIPGDLLTGEYFPYNTESYLGFSPGGVTNKGQGQDVIRQLYPWKFFSVSEIKNFEIPLWNPYNFSGTPHAANFQTGVFYPLNIIFLIFSFNFSWTVFILMIPILSGFFTYLYLKELGIRKALAFFSGIVFSYSSYMVVWMEYGNIGHVFLWLPFLLYLTEKINKRKNFIFYSFLLVFVLTSSILAGYIQGLFYVYIIIFFYYFYILEKSKRIKITKKNILFLTSIILPFLLSAFQFLPTIELFMHSARSDYSLDQITNLLNPFWYQITTLIPNFFGHPASRNFWFNGTYLERVSYFGLIPLFFALFSLFYFKKDKTIYFFGIVFLVSLILSMDLFFTRYIYLIKIPVISTTVPTRILSIFVFSGSILCAKGLEYFFRYYDRKKLIYTSVFLSLVFLSAWVFIVFSRFFYSSAEFYSNLNVSFKNTMYSSALFICFISALIVFIRYINKKNSQKIFILLILFLTVFDLFYFFHKFVPFSPGEFIFPKQKVFSYISSKNDIYRIWGYGSGGIETNFETFEGISGINGYDPLHIRRYNEFISTSKNGKYEKTETRSDVNIFPGYGETDLKANKYRKRVLDLLGVKYIINKKENNPDQMDSAFDEKDFKLIWNNKSIQIYENRNVLPRIFLAKNYHFEDNDSEIINIIHNGKLNLRDTVILEEKIGREYEKNSMQKRYKNNDMVEVVLYSPNKIIIKTNSSENRILFLSDPYYPGWKAKVNNKEEKILRANFAFRALPLSKGEKNIVFYFSPESFSTGIAVSLISLIISVIFIFYFLYEKISRK